MFIFTIVISWFLDKNKEFDEDSKFFRFLLYSCTKIIIFFARIRIFVKGIACVPTDGRYLYVSSHKSNFDPILSWEVMGKEADLCFISKPENFNKPVFGKVMRRCCFMSIDRDNPRNALKTIDRAANFIKEDKFSIAVYPEGTRNTTEEQLLPFHTGLFKIAKKANVPIVVGTTRNCERIHKNFPFKGTKVYYDFCGVIPAEEVRASSNVELGEKIRNMMLNSFNDFDINNFEKLKEIKKRRKQQNQ